LAFLAQGVEEVSDAEEEEEDRCLLSSGRTSLEGSTRERGGTEESAEYGHVVRGEEEREADEERDERPESQSSSRIASDEGVEKGISILTTAFIETRWRASIDTARHAQDRQGGRKDEEEEEGEGYYYYAGDHGADIVIRNWLHAKARAEGFGRLKIVLLRPPLAPPLTI
jgi:hypothetical protein